MKLALRAVSWSWLLPLAIGVAAFLAMPGPYMLDPRHVDWIRADDPKMHYLGWTLFRHGPMTFPIGRNPDYGLELSSSIVYSDSIPLFAVASKLLSSWLPEPFQYFGIFIFACFVLQAWFGWKLIGLASPSPAIRALGCAFFVVAPPLFWRVPMHLSLVAHFVVLAALYLCLRPQQTRRIAWWAILVALVTAIHAYLLAMVLALWAASLMTRLVRSFDRATAYVIVSAIAREVAVVGSAMLIVAWQVGYFGGGPSLGREGYGFYRMNLLSPIASGGWSRVLYQLSVGPGDYEGYAYLGLGVMALAIVSIPMWVRRRAALGEACRREAILIGVLGLLVLFAVTNHVGIGMHDFTIAIPEPLERMALVLRASGRMVWPAYYAVVFAIVAGVVRSMRPSRAIGLLAAALLLQIIDLIPSWNDVAHRMFPRSAETQSALVEPFWKDAATRHRFIRRIDPRNHPSHWSEFAGFAAANRLATDSVYLARIDGNRVAEMSRRYGDLTAMPFQRDSVYVVDDDRRMRTLLQFDPDADLFATIDGYNVLAPGWRQCVECQQPASSIRASDIARPVAIGDRIDFSGEGGGGNYLVDDCAEIKTATAGDGDHGCLIVVPVRGAFPNSLRLETTTPSDLHPPATVVVEIGSPRATRVTLTRPLTTQVEIPVAPEQATSIVDQRLLIVNVRILDDRPPDRLQPGTVDRARRTPSTPRLVAITLQ